MSPCELLHQSAPTSWIDLPVVDLRSSVMMPVYSVGSGMGLPSPRQGNCSSVIGLIVDEGADGLWKLITGDENQYVWTGPHYPNSSTDFDSQVGHRLLSFARHA